MKKITTLVLALVLSFNFAAKADEGMWILSLINKNYDEMKAMGFKLTPEDIYSINNGSMKDAIVMFGQHGRGFCTAEIISDQGLVLTNHHCGYGTIQYHSSVEHDYLKDGFWAYNKGEELHTPGQFVKFLVSIEDVTDKALAGITDGMTEKERADALRKNNKAIEEAAGEGNEYETRVRSFFGGNHFYLLKYESYNDVRFVGAPPSSIGKFGHDSDNWMWPRHTGDFSMFRVYMSKDGKSAKYDESNVPLKPKHFLPVSIKGVEKGDFTMVLGYPGGTQRYMTSFEIDEVQTITHPNRIKLRGIRQGIMMKDMQADQKVNIQYSSKYSRSSNYWKFSIGQKAGLEKLKVRDQKEEIQNDFTKWLNANDARKTKYGKALSTIENAVKGRAEYAHATQYLSECFFQSVEIAGASGRLSSLLPLLDNSKKNKKKIKEASAKIQTSADAFFKNYNMPTDKKVSAAMLAVFFKDIDSKYYPEIYSMIEGKYKGDLQAFVDDLFKTSIFRSPESVAAFLKNPSKEQIENDLAFQLITSAREKYAELSGKSKSFKTEFSKGHRLFISGLLEMNPEKNYSPDANFTMRLSYGTVGDYQARDAVHYSYITTLSGIMEKAKPGDYEFDVSQKLIDLYNKKDYGQYGMDGVMPVCFTSNNDITGGNSGSPVINGNGELVGLAFDGNWEAMSGDIAFETELQKCINVDIRYVLFIIDKYAGATNLIDELKIVK